MQRARTTESEREASLRRVAIVLSSLPAPIAAQLLGTVDPQSKQLLRRAMTSLSDVDPLERQRALHAFKTAFPNSQPQSRPRRGEIEDEIAIDSSRARPESRVVSGVGILPEAAAKESTPLSFLEDVDDDTLARFLKGEHPQTVALVLASIAPAVAARVLPRLDPAVQTDALGRIGRLGEIPKEVIEDLAVHLRDRIGTVDPSQSETGRRALGAILAAMPHAPLASPSQHTASKTSRGAPSSQSRPDSMRPVSEQTSGSDSQSVRLDEVAATPIPSVTDSDTSLGNSSAVAASRGDTPVGNDRHELQPRRSQDVPPTGYSSSDLSAVDQTHRLRLVTNVDDEPDMDWAEANSRGPESESDPTQPAEPFRSTILNSTDAIHEFLTRLPADQLCGALGQVSTREAILTLCGLPNDVADAALSVLPRGQAKQVRRGMTSLQSLELREIDQAKEAVARIANSGPESTRSVAEPERMAA